MGEICGSGLAPVGRRAEPDNSCGTGFAPELDLRPWCQLSKEELSPAEGKTGAQGRYSSPEEAKPASPSSLASFLPLLLLMAAVPTYLL